MGISDDVIKKIIRRVLRVSKPDQIILFGSAAAGRMTSDSDIDLLIVKKNVKDRFAESAKIDNVLGGLGYPFDVIVMPLERFEETKNLIGGLAYPANKYGKVIYAQTA
jgi:predicted nucleotidyltransferase